MFKYALKVDSNMIASGNLKHIIENDKRRIKEELLPSTSDASSFSDIKFEMILKEMEKMIYKPTVYNKPLNREKNQLQIRNLNFRRLNPPQPQQIQQRDIRNPRNPNE